MELGIWEAFWGPQGVLDAAPEAKHIQSYFQLKTSLKCQRQLARARFA